MCKEAHDRFEYPWLVSRSVSVGGRGNNRKSDTDYRRYRDFSLVIATPSDTITWTTGDYEYQVSLHIRCLRYDTARSLSLPSPLVNKSAKQISAMEILRFPSSQRFPRVEDPFEKKRYFSKEYIYVLFWRKDQGRWDEGDFKEIWRRLKIL